MTSALDTFYSHARWAYAQKVSDHYLLAVIEQPSGFTPAMITTDLPEGLQWGDECTSLEGAIAAAHKLATDQYAWDAIACMDYA